MAGMADLTKSEVVKRLQAAHTRIQNVRKETAEISGRVVDTAVGMTGGIGCGIIRGYNEDGSPIVVPGTEIPLDVAVSAAAIAVGVTGMAGESSRHLNSFGVGMGAAAAAFHVQKMVRERDKS